MHSFQKLPLWFTVGAEADDDKIELLLKEVKGKDITELIAAGREKLASVPSGGGAVAVAAPTGGAAAGGGGAAAPEAKEEKKVEEKEESDDVRYEVTPLCIYMMISYPCIPDLCVFLSTGHGFQLIRLKGV